MEIAVIADELTAVGWRLAGARVQMPATENMTECLRAARHSADLVLITAALAAAVPAAQLTEALLSVPPLILVMADLRHAREVADVEDEVRRALGIAL